MKLNEYVLYQYIGKINHSCEVRILQIAYISSFVPVRGKSLAEWMDRMNEMGHDVTTPALGIQGTAGWVTNASELISKMICFHSSSRPTASTVLNTVEQLQGMYDQSLFH